MDLLTPALIAAALLCGLVAGFLFGFWVVAMPGLARLDDRAFLRAFRVMDGVIQRNEPRFMLMWVGSVVAVVAVLVLALGGASGPRSLLILVGVITYLFGVQLPTAAINIPLNNRVQSLALDRLDDDAARAERTAFEGRWNRWNGIRTGFAVVATLVWILALAGG